MVRLRLQKKFKSKFNWVITFLTLLVLPIFMFQDKSWSLILPRLSKYRYSKHYYTEVNSSETAELIPGLVVDWYQDLAVNPTVYNFKWHPLFPHFAEKSTIMTTLSESVYIYESYARRIYGFLIPEKTSEYEFEMGSRDGMEVLLADANMQYTTFTNMTTILNLSFTPEEMALQDKNISAGDIFTKTVSINLQKDKLYFIDILQGGANYGRINIKWRIKNDVKQTFVEIKNIYHNKVIKDQCTKKTLHKKLIPRFGISENERHRLRYHNISAFKLNSIVEKFSCERYPKKVSQISEWKGVTITETWATYPDDLFGFYRPFTRNQVVLNESEALEVVTKTFQTIKTALGKMIPKFRFQHIVQIQKNFNHGYENLPKKDQFYFVEFDIEIGEKYVPHRVTTYVQLSNEKKICFRNDFVWNAKSKIYIISPVRNQATWIHYLTHSIDEVMQKTGEKNVELVIVDYNSTDANVTEILEMHRTPYKYIYMKGFFNRVEGINTGLKHIDDDSIGFVLDLHIEIPDNIFDKVRKHTLKGISAYGPTVLKFFKGHHEQFTEVPNNNHWEWVDVGYGLMSMYKSDWTAIGGMNERLFSTRWGGEDWEFVDRLLSNGYYLFHSRLPRFYHIHHSKKKMWDVNN